MTKKNVFISYARQDADSANEIRRLLEDSELPVWFDRRDMVPGAPWQESIQAALKEASTVLLLVGAAGIGKWQSLEVNAAVTRSLEGGQLRVVPVLLPGSNPGRLPPLLRSLQCIDLREAGAYDHRIARLAATLLMSPDGQDSPNDERVADRLSGVGDYAGALDHYRRALGEASDDPSRAEEALRLQRKLGTTLHALGDLAGAAEVFERSLEADAERFGRQSEAVGADLNNLAVLRRSMGDAESALRLLEEAVAIAATPAEKAGRLNNRGAVLRDLGRLEEAVATYEEALALMRDSLGDGHPEVATSIGLLASALADLGRLEEARALHEESIHRLRATLGDSHPSTASALHSLAIVLQRLGDMEQARSLLEHSLELKRHVYGTEAHPAVTATLQNLASLLLSSGRLDEAQSLLERVIELELVLYGSRNHPSIAQSELSLANCLAARGNMDEAKSLYEHAVGVLGGRPESGWGRWMKAPVVSVEYDRFGGLVDGVQAPKTGGEASLLPPPTESPDGEQ